MATRIWTYITLDGEMEPLAAGTWFDPLLADLDAVTAQNMLVQMARTGYPMIIHDPSPQYPVSGSLAIGVIHVDLVSGQDYEGDPCYLGPVLYDLHVNHLPICIFRENINETAKKCYVAYMQTFDRILAGQATDEIHDMMHLSRRQMPRLFQFGLTIILDGEYTDIDDIESATWHERFPMIGSS